MTITVIERLAHVAPLGLLLRDEVTGEIVTEGLCVRIVPLHRGKPVEAFRTPSGAFAVRGIPGLRAWETRDVGPNGLPVDVAAPAVPVRIEVRDELGRFHGFTTETDLPVPGGLLAPVPVSPPEGAYVPLFSLPCRPVPAGTAAVRARLLEEHDATTPAAYARLAVTAPDGRTAVGVADDRGEVLVCLPYPAPTSALGSPPAGGAVGSPPASTRVPLARARWTMALDVFAPDPVLSPPGRPRLPDLDTLTKQSMATLVTATSPPVVKTTDTLVYGRELVLRSSPTDAVHYVRR